MAKRFVWTANPDCMIADADKEKKISECGNNVILSVFDYVDTPLRRFTK